MPQYIRKNPYIPHHSWMTSHIFNNTSSQLHMSDSGIMDALQLITQGMKQAISIFWDSSSDF